MYVLSTLLYHYNLMFPMHIHVLLTFSVLTLSFQFNVFHYSCLFGTFLCNCEKQRADTVRQLYIDDVIVCVALYCDNYIVVYPVIPYPRQTCKEKEREIKDRQTQ